MSVKSFVTAVAAAALATSLAAVTHVGKAAEVTPIKKGYALKLEGMIEPGDDRRLANAYRISCRKYKRCPERVFLSSPGGVMGPAYETAQLITQLGMDTVVAHNEICSSACFWIFAAGKHRAVRPGAYLGVHQPIYPGDDYPDREITLYWADVLESWGVPYRIIRKMVTTSPEDMAWIQREDAGNWIEVVR